MKNSKYVLKKSENVDYLVEFSIIDYVVSENVIFMILQKSCTKIDLKKKRNLLDDEGLPKKTDDAIAELRKINNLQEKYMDDLLNNKPLNAVELQRQKVDFFKRSE